MSAGGGVLADAHEGPPAPSVRLIVDTDIGLGVPGADIDDGYALGLLATDPGAAIELITTVNGNTDVWTATACARNAVELLGLRGVPVVMGAASPLCRPQEGRRASSASAAPAVGEAAMRIAQLATESPGRVTVLAIGPLTNIAIAIAIDPRVVGAMKELVVMGGVFTGQTNHSGLSGEWNIWVDPEAAQAVLRSGVRVRFVGLDVTMRFALREDQVAEIARRDTPFAKLAGEAGLAWLRTLREHFPKSELDAQFHAHDAVAAIGALHPELFTWAPARVSVASAEPARGATLTDLLGHASPPEPNCEVAIDADFPAVAELLMAGLLRS